MKLYQGHDVGTVCFDFPDAECTHGVFIKMNNEGLEIRNCFTHRSYHPEYILGIDIL
jgi:hypothetical protein